MMADLIRLQKYLAECGIASRRRCEAFIGQGRVTVNGIAAHLGQSVDPGVDEVRLDGESVRSDRKTYVVLNKPQGVITSAGDPHGRRTVLDLISGVNERIFPVGRLDMDVSGTLLLTNDGELSHRISHPSFEVEKVYRAWVCGCLSRASAASLERGVLLDGGITAPAKVRILKTAGDSTLIRLVIHEGRKRLVKRMCATVGHPVRHLTRIRVGTVGSGDLNLGEWRYLSREEVKDLRKLVGLPG